MSLSKSLKVSALKEKINQLEQEARRLKEQLKEAAQEECVTISVPESLQPIFLKAQDYVREYFSDKRENPEHGTIDIQGERYIMVRAASMSKEFFDTISSHYQERGSIEARRVATGFLFDLALSLGKADARNFHSMMNVTNPIDKLSAGPIHFAYTGWAFVKLLKDSNPSPDENYYMIYDHPFSFESDVWLREGKLTDFPVCIMNAGYSSGWCEESFGIPLVAVEVECRARGDDHCRFIMAPPSRIEAYIEQYKSQPYSRVSEEGVIEIPEFFQRKRLEDEVRQSEETARALLDAPTESAFLLDTSGKILALNKTAEERLANYDSQLIGKNVFHLFNRDVARQRLKYHRQVVRTGKPVQYIDQRENRWFQTQVIPILDSKGEAASIALYSRDITELKKNEAELEQHRNHLEELISERTSELLAANEKLSREIAERKRAEKALQDEKERLAVTLTSIAAGVIVTDTQGRITMLNGVAEKWSGWEQKKAKDRLIDDIFHIYEDHPGKEEKIALINRTKETINQPLQKEGILYNRDGLKRLITTTASPIVDKKKQLIGYIYVIRDITETKRIEEEFLKHRKIESIGILAGGIAHDFNNLLTVILGNISLVKLDIDEDTKSYHRLDVCERTCISAKNLTNQLLTFSKGGEPVKKIVILNKFLRETISFALSGSRVVAKFHLPKGIWAVEVDEGQFGQVINNLVINAVQAMTKGGTLHVSLENYREPEKDHAAPSNRYVKITLRDEGCGIPPEDLPKIFDPYFTTKKNGSGLGLASSYSIIKRHKGKIRIDSEPGKGTTAIIELTAVDAPATTPLPEKKKNKIGNLGRILLMDDEELVRNTGREMIETLGFGVETAAHGEQAISRYRQALLDGNPFQAVIMDLTVPGGLGGKETVQILRDIDPKVRAIVSSGYSNDPIMANYTQFGFAGVVVKPYRVEEMQNTLEQVLKSIG
jgi:PAS domain S-box-containing protein